MNSWQFAQELQRQVRALTWPGSSHEVFHNEGVQIVSGGRDGIAAFVMRSAFPMLGISPQGGQSDPDFQQQPKLTRREFEIVIGQRAYDSKGEKILIKINPPDQLRSSGRGLLEFEAPVLGAIALLGPKNGVSIESRLLGANTVVRREQDLIAIASYRLSVEVTPDTHYPGVSSLKAVDDGGGNATLTWKNPGVRYDRLKLVIRRAAGSVPPASPTAGTDVPITAFPETITDSPGVGTFSYSMFVWYDDLNHVVAEEVQLSESRTISGLVVT